MPFIEINQAQIYYETYGEAQAGQAPIVLIHGSTNTAHYEWSRGAPLLGRHYYVIAPDCRGHGQSSNPGHSYSFLEMAADTATLIRALGFERAHVIGHSNGGNVALVTLMEYPEVVQSAVLQAANAYVSQDLIDIEPDKFDPERVLGEDPQWVQHMIAHHGPTHGAEYWRELLQLTLVEIISQPNYTSAALQAVQRPTLVIQGEVDRVNAPSRHGQYIAEHIPFAEAWIPAGVGHNVHEEKLFEWVERIERFLKQRGSPANEALYRLRMQNYPDEREAIFDVHAAPGKQNPQAIVLSGETLNIEQRQAARAALAAFSIEEDEIQILLDEKTPWGLVKRGVTDLRRSPSNQAERVSQALVGDAVRILKKQAGWVFVRMPRDGYMGWVHSQAIHLCKADDVARFHAACNTLVLDGLLPAYAEPDAGTPGQCITLPFGARLPALLQEAHWTQISLPDGQTCWVQSSGLLPFEQRPALNPAGAAWTLERLQAFIGVPYLWGGCTPFGYDCSGLAAAFYGFMGLNLPRDADQQCQVGREVEGPAQPGDLLFFGRASNRASGRHLSITHVAISLGNNEILHANGDTWSTAQESLDPQNPHYRPDLVESLVAVRRYL